eukprot:TRINITY_DN4695_c0_g1_i1.p1 TRINITY_DN4695_c0_g1~~TRINITY_DN4695_c0_g1_i1.p1  ORF type:complete len:356 (+),score=35.84 TRINITY_DN4695_c0_g1_i1:132-1070(+)
MFYGFTQVVGAIAVKTINPFFLVTFRVLLAAPLMAILVWIFVKTPIKMSSKDTLMCALLGFLGTSFNDVLVFWGLMTATPTEATVIMCVCPILTALIEASIGRDSFTCTKVLGFILAVMGMFSIVTKFDLDFKMHTGSVLIFSAQVLFSLFLVLQLPIVERNHHGVVNMWVHIFGAMWLVVFSPFFLQYWKPEDWGFEAYGSVVFLTIFVSIGCFWSQAWILKFTSSSHAAIWLASSPLASAGAEWVLYSAVPGWPAVLGFVFVALGLYLVVTQQGKVDATRAISYVSLPPPDDFFDEDILETTPIIPHVPL